MNENEDIIIKSHFINTIMPKFLKHFFWNSIIFLIIYGIYYIIDKSANYNINLIVILILIIFTILISIFKISKDLIIILNTSYEFYSNHLEVKFKFITEKSQLINYEQIIDIITSKNIWDRICGVGDLTINTSNDIYANKQTKPLILSNVKNPEEIKNKIMNKININSNPHNQQESYQVHRN